MSNFATCVTEIKSEPVVKRTCTRLGMRSPTHVKNRYIGGVKCDGVEVAFPTSPGSTATAVINLSTGLAQYDSDYRHYFPQFIDAYSIEAIKYKAELEGHVAVEGRNADGEITVEVEVY